MRSAVDLPQPDGPSSTRNSRSAIVEVEVATATTSPKRFVTWSKTTRAIAGGI